MNSFSLAQRINFYFYFCKELSKTARYSLLAESCQPKQVQPIHLKLLKKINYLIPSSADTVHHSASIDEASKHALPAQPMEHAQSTTLPAISHLHDKKRRRLLLSEQANIDLTVDASLKRIKFRSSTFCIRTSGYEFNTDQLTHYRIRRELGSMAEKMSSATLGGVGKFGLWAREDDIGLILKPETASVIGAKQGMAICFIDGGLRNETGSFSKAIRQAFALAGPERQEKLVQAVQSGLQKEAIEDDDFGEILKSTRVEAGSLLLKYQEIKCAAVRKLTISIPNICWLFAGRLSAPSSGRTRRRKERPAFFTLPSRTFSKISPQEEDGLAFAFLKLKEMPEAAQKSYIQSGCDNAKASQKYAGRTLAHNEHLLLIDMPDGQNDGDIQGIVVLDNPQSRKEARAFKEEYSQLYGIAADYQSYNADTGKISRITQHESREFSRKCKGGKRRGHTWRAARGLRGKQSRGQLPWH
ncbi:MAG: hypothetical protein ACRYGK_16130 [Janthinobacterium lividum]